MIYFRKFVRGTLNPKDNAKGDGTVSPCDSIFNKASDFAHPSFRPYRQDRDKGLKDRGDGNK